MTETNNLKLKKLEFAKKLSGQITEQNLNLVKIDNEINKLKSTAKGYVTGDLKTWIISQQEDCTFYTKEDTQGLPTGMTFCAGRITHRGPTKYIFIEANNGKLATIYYNGTVWTAWRIYEASSIEIVEGEGKA